MMSDECTFTVEVTERDEYDVFLAVKGGEQTANAIPREVARLMGSADRAEVTVTPIRMREVERQHSFCTEHWSIYMSDGSCERADRRGHRGVNCEFVPATVTYTIPEEA